MAGKDPGIEQADAMTIFDQVQVRERKSGVVLWFCQSSRLPRITTFTGVGLVPCALCTE